MTGCCFFVMMLLLTCVVWGVLLKCIATAHQDTCGIIRYLQFRQPEKDHSLKGHVFRNLSIGGRRQCEEECLREKECVSINIGPSSNNMRACELSNSDHFLDRKGLKARTGWTYRGTVNLCATYPCLNNGKCYLGYTDKNYMCECPAGYTGENCEKDINECEAKTHNCSADAICNNTKGSFDCTCKPGYTGDGHNCTDINECEAAETYNCSVDAICNNTKGSFDCTCKPGYTGDGHNCTELLIDSTILSKNGSYLQHLYRFFAPDLENSRWLLCWRASLHGWDVASQFHPRCDGKENTTTIIKKGEYVFGGFADIPWDSSGSFGYSIKAFIFSLRDKEGLAPFKSLVKYPSYAINRDSSYGPIFGIRVIVIANNASTNNNSHTWIGPAYRLPKEAVKDPHTILAGTHRFSPDEVEVFYLYPSQ